MECYVRKHDKLVRHLDMCIEEVSREYARVTMPITENHKNGMGVAHGGAIFSLADHHVPHTILYVKPLHLVKWVES